MDRRLTAWMAMGLSTAAMMACSVAVAQPASEHERALQACVAEADDHLRLQCYDRAMQRSAVAVSPSSRPPSGVTASSPVPNPPTASAPPVAASPSPVSASAPPPAASPPPVAASPPPRAALPPAGIPAAPPPAPAPQAEQSFGLPPPPAPRPAARSMTAEVTWVSVLPQGVLRVRLANDQEWEGVDSSSAEFPLRAGDSVTVKPASLGSFLMTGSESGHRSIRVRRIR